MCGIVAVASFSPTDWTDVAGAMSDVLAHRGPDDSGLAALPSEGVALAQRRLSIVDLEGGHQPMWDERQRLCVVFNGEIYNCAELREHLVELGHKFVTDHSDTEVLVHGYEQWGTALFPKLNGMFAIALWDRERRALVLARDRAGEKPLYLAQLPGGGCAVSSEIKALLPPRRGTQDRPGRPRAVPVLRLRDRAADHAARRREAAGWTLRRDLGLRHGGPAVLETGLRAPRVERGRRGRSLR